MTSNRSIRKTASSTKINLIKVILGSGSSIAVHFDDYQESIRDLHSQIIGPASGGSAGASYEVRIVLVEA